MKKILPVVILVIAAASLIGIGLYNKGRGKAKLQIAVPKEQRMFLAIGAQGSG